MSNPYTKSHQAGQHQAWLEGLRAGVALAKESAVPVCYTSYEYEDEIGWYFVDEALKKLEEECK